MTEGVVPQSSEWRVVATDAGPVTLATVDQLEQRATEWRAWSQRSKAELHALGNQAEDHLAAAGALLVAHASDWTVPPELQSAVDEARSLTDQVATDDRNEAALKQQEASSGLVGKIEAKYHERGIQQDRDKSAVRLRSLLIPISRSAPSAALPEADTDRKAAADLEAQAAALETETKNADAWTSSCEAEVARRKDAIKAMGFDSLYEAALLQISGAPAVESPLVLKARERAYLSVPATLARMVSRTLYVGGSSGFTFPIGHTGIRYRVGSFRGQPVHQESLTKIDSGTLVATNQRVAYVGRAKSVAFALTKVLHVEVYNDAISIAREGKENPDFFLLASPKHAVFLLNWCLSQHDS